MTQLMLDRAVARSIGESLATVRRLGFSPLPACASDSDPDDLRLALDCPFCGRRCDLPADRDGLPAMAECDHCDIFFEYHPDEVYPAAGASRPGAASDAA